MSAIAISSTIASSPFLISSRRIGSRAGSTDCALMRARRPDLDVAVVVEAGGGARRDERGRVVLVDEQRAGPGRRVEVARGRSPGSRAGRGRGRTRLARSRPAGRGRGREAPGAGRARPRDPAVRRRLISAIGSSSDAWPYWRSCSAAKAWRRRVERPRSRRRARLGHRDRQLVRLAGVAQVERPAQLQPVDVRPRPRALGLPRPRAPGTRHRRRAATDALERPQERPHGVVLEIGLEQARPR